MKLYECFTLAPAAEFNITIGDTTKTLHLNKFSIKIMSKYEEDGLSGANLMEKLQDKFVTYGTKLAWDLLVEKDEFNNSLDTFREVLTVKDLNTLSQALTTVIQASEVKND